MQTRECLENSSEVSYSPQGAEFRPDFQDFGAAGTNKSALGGALEHFAQKRLCIVKKLNGQAASRESKSFVDAVLLTAPAEIRSKVGTAESTYRACRDSTHPFV